MRRTIIVALLLRSALAFGEERLGWTSLIVAYDEQQTDSERSRLVADLLKIIPGERWVPAKTMANDAWETIINRHYHYYPKDYPKTVAVLKRALIRENRAPLAELKRRGFVRLPTLPERGYRDYGFHNRPMRIFDAETSTWTSAQTFRDIPAAKSSLKHKAGTVTAFTLDVPLATLAKLAMKHESLLTDAQVFSHPEGAPVKFFASKPCDTLMPFIERSPYKALALQRVSNLSSKNSRRFSERTKRRFRIVDWDFAGGHGSKVYNAAMLLLNLLHLGGLSQYMDRIELNPRIASKEIQQTVDLYYDYVLRHDGQSDSLDIAKRDAEHWIRTYQPTGSDKETVNEFVLKSIFWRFLSDEPSVVNFSFSISSSGLGLELANLSQSGFAAVAAGNTMEDLNPDSVPQAIAATWPELVNTTYGTADATVLGAHSGVEFTTKVSLLAPGCGMQFGTLLVSDEGSSFASPLVAASAWVKFIADGTDAKALKRALLLASRPTSKVPQVESAGIYDPYLLLAAVGAHILTRDDRILAYHHGDLSLVFLQNGKLETFYPQHVQANAVRHTLTFYECGKRTCAVVRHVQTTEPAVDEIESFEVRKFSLKLFDSEGHTIVDTSANRAPTIQQLWF